MGKLTYQWVATLCSLVEDRQGLVTNVTVLFLRPDRMSVPEDKPVIGVLALQGSFREHMTLVEKVGGRAVEVRRPAQLNGCSGLIIPGGESTVMAKLARNWGLVWHFHTETA